MRPSLLDKRFLFQSAETKWRRQWQMMPYCLHVHNLCTQSKFQCYCDSKTTQLSHLCGRISCLMPVSLKQEHDKRSVYISRTRIALETLKFIRNLQWFPNVLCPTDFDQHQSHSGGYMVDRVTPDVVAVGAILFNPGLRLSGTSLPSGWGFHALARN